MDKNTNTVDYCLDLSIVMPVYNAADTISDSVKSFQLMAKKLQKDFSLDCRLYIVDDCSTDKTTQVIDSLSQLSDNIVFIKNNENLGPGLSRNKALDLIEDGYIGFLDADDEIIADDYIDSYIKGVDLGADWITFNGWFCSENVQNSKYDFERLIDDTKQLSIRCLKGELDGSVIFSIYSSRLIHGNNLRFPSGYYEDIPFSYSAMLLAENRYISDNFSYKKHNVSTSIVNTVSEKHIKGMVDAWVKVDHILKDYKLSNFQSDRIYGLYGYIASAISSIILNDHAFQYKAELFNLLSTEIESKIVIDRSDYNVETKKDKLVEFFLDNFSKRKSSFVSDIDFFYNRLFSQNA